MTEAQKQYNTLLENGELRDMFPQFKGEWEKDKKAFTKYYDENEALLNGDLDEDYDEDDVNYYTDYDSF